MTENAALRKLLEERKDATRLARIMATKEDPTHVAPGMVYLARNGEFVSYLWCNNDPKSVAMTTVCGAGAFRATELVTIAELIVSSTAINPVTEEPWEEEDMAVFLDNYPHLNTDHKVCRAFLLVAMNREGDIIYDTMPYVVRGNKVVWLDRVVTDEENAFIGLSAVWRAAMSVDTMIGTFDTPEEWRENVNNETAMEAVATDLAAMKAIKDDPGDTLKMILGSAICADVSDHERHNAMKTLYAKEEPRPGMKMVQIPGTKDGEDIVVHEVTTEDIAEWVEEENANADHS